MIGSGLKKSNTIVDTPNSPQSPSSKNQRLSISSNSSNRKKKKLYLISNYIIYIYHYQQL